MKNYPNYNFYNNGSWDEVKIQIQNIIKSYHNDPKSVDLQKLYNYFECDHSFIQWMFPNFIPSRFNKQSHNLTLEERELMVKSQNVLKRFYKNYKLILLFFGIEIKYMDFEEGEIDDSLVDTSNQKKIQTKIQRKSTEQTSILQYFHGKIQQQSNDDTSQLILKDKQQFEKCCFKNTHNLLRLKRILGSLSVLKHRREAIQLCNFLKTQFKVLGREKIYLDYFSGFEEYEEEVPSINKRYFNGYKEMYVEQSLIEKVDISIIN